MPWHHRSEPSGLRMHRSMLSGNGRPVMSMDSRCTGGSKDRESGWYPYASAKKSACLTSKSDAGGLDFEYA